METSRPWVGRTSDGYPGDSGPYSASQWQQLYAHGLNHGMENIDRGVMRGVLEELEVIPANPADTTVTVEPGAAFVQGIFYLNDADKILNIASNASGSTRIDVVILEADYTAQTVRLDVVQGTPGAGLPSLTQSAGTIWQIPLAYLTLASGFTSIAASAITDFRHYANIPDAVGIPVLNASGGALEMGTLVYLFAGGNPPQVAASSTEGQRNILGVIESRVLNGAVGRVITQGIFPVMCDELVAAGALLEASTTAGQAQKEIDGGVFARVLQANTGGGTRALSYINVLPDVGLAYPAIGTYTGDGAATKAVTGLGFVPRAILIYGQVDNAGFSHSAVKTNQDGLFSLASWIQYEVDHIISLDADGFTVGDGTGGTNGNTVNVGAEVYVYEAWR